MYFYRICKSSNRFLKAVLHGGTCAKNWTPLRVVPCNTALKAETATFIISNWQVETIVQLFADVGVESYSTYKGLKTE